MGWIAYFFSGHEQCKPIDLLFSYFVAFITNRFNNQNMGSGEERVESAIIHLLQGSDALCYVLKISASPTEIKVFSQI